MDEPAHVAAAVDYGAPPTGTETILVVEDEAPVRAFVSRVLQQYGYTVFEAGRAEEAVRWLKDTTQPIQLIVTDAVLPGRSGREVADVAMALRPDIRVLFVSGHAAPALERRGILSGGEALLEKPFSAAALGRQVRAVLDARD
jgi:DNA-binding response OmpR family regulator